MQLTVTVAEALSLAAAKQPLPPFVRSVDAEGSTLRLRVDISRLPDAPSALRFVAAAVGTVDVVVRFTGYADGVATLAVTSQARGLPVHTLLNALTDTATAQLRRRGLGDVVEIRRGASEPTVAVHVQRAVEARTAGLVVTAVDLRDATVHATVAVGPPGTVRLP
ncbi:hypothetical protein [Cellulomonas carbonis]|uniref:Uncharacterized protein n=1 Tax=Cellulomonas carbonis T26 TaxID=947969 RepID=A0A0A0BQS5_9CELL|nr:hypothetical protein [Cellulomonas carbonis]KGM10316.1 hypothetical protein N868_09280 [Cellulomonas carbonis T26]MDT0164625.1 hypothetical protein [Actinotalea sp. AC32]GGC00237.1 hypothetical protein GCM10010972_11230 [Cellulomonas carbonis]